MEEGAMNETAIPTEILDSKALRLIRWMWLGALVTAILFFDGLFLWNLIDLSHHYEGELTIMRGHELCELRMVQAIFNAMLWLGGGAAVLLGITVALMFKAMAGWQSRLLLLLSVIAIGLVIFVGSDDWLTAGIDEKIHEQSHQLLYGIKAGEHSDSR
jgi:hypothetical protein